MIKRRFYKQERADKDEASDSSSSSSDSDAVEDEDDEVEEEEEEEEEIAAEKQEEKPSSPSSGSGYESEDSSANEVDLDSPDSLVNEDEDRPDKGGKNLESWPVENGEEKLSNVESKSLNAKDQIEAEYADYVLKCKSVFRCRLCPRIVCLTQDTLKAHLKSKRHARSKKLLDEGRLKLMLNSDGEIEEDQETHSERHARTVALVQDLANPKKRNRGRQRQRERLRKKKFRDHPEEGKAKKSTKGRTNDDGETKKSAKSQTNEDGKAKKSAKSQTKKKRKVVD